MEEQVNVAPVEAPAPPVEGKELPPRDKVTGRFSKAAQEAALGITSSTPGAPPVASASEVTPPPAASAPVAPAPEVVAAAPDDDLKALDDFISKIPAATPAPTVAPTPPVQQAPPPLSPALQQIQMWGQNEQMAQQAIQYASTFARVDAALQQGDVAGALQFFSPDAQQAIVDHIYRTQGQQLVQRYTDEQSGQKPDPRVDQMQRQLQALTQQLQTRSQAEETARQQAEQQRQYQERGQQLRTFLDGMFESVKLKDSPARGWIESRVAHEVGKDPNARALVSAGQYGPIATKFREVLGQWKQVTSPTPNPQPAPASAQLMTAATGTAAAPAPQNNSLVGSDGKLSGKAIVTRLKDFLGNKAS